MVWGFAEDVEDLWGLGGGLVGGGGGAYHGLELEVHELHVGAGGRERGASGCSGGGEAERGLQRVGLGQWRVGDEQPAAAALAAGVRCGGAVEVQGEAAGAAAGGDVAGQAVDVVDEVADLVIEVALGREVLVVVGAAVQAVQDTVFLAGELGEHGGRRAQVGKATRGGARLAWFAGKTGLRCCWLREVGCFEMPLIKEEGLKSCHGCTVTVYRSNNRPMGSDYGVQASIFPTALLRPQWFVHIQGFRRVRPPPIHRTNVERAASPSTPVPTRAKATPKNRRIDESDGPARRDDASGRQPVRVRGEDSPSHDDDNEDDARADAPGKPSRKPPRKQSPTKTTRCTSRPRDKNEVIIPAPPPRVDATTYATTLLFPVFPVFPADLHATHDRQWQWLKRNVVPDPRKSCARAVLFGPCVRFIGGQAPFVGAQRPAVRPRAHAPAIDGADSLARRSR